jgi:hypothetical protein
MFELFDPNDVTLLHVVTETVANLTLRPEDQALVVLAQRLAALIDDAEDQERAFYRHSPRLMAALSALGATPAARPKQQAPAPAGGALAALREDR